jgi:hypothetical protein
MRSGIPADQDAKREAENMNPDISEFSYGYALTDELIHWHGTSLTAAPFFPSLYQEGQPGGGYDVKLERPGLPLFLQFKLSHCMVRNTAQEVKDGLFVAPFYRMHIRPARHSRQHEMLLELENAGNDVYYAAPAFHTPEELNDAYLKHQVRSQSILIRPSVVGPLPDDDPHHIAFQLPGIYHFCSKPRPLDTKGNFEEFSHHMEVSFRQRAKNALTEKSLIDLADKIALISSKDRDIFFDSQKKTMDELEEYHPLYKIAFYSYVFMDCHLFIVLERE